MRITNDTCFFVFVLLINLPLYSTRARTHTHNRILPVGAAGTWRDLTKIFSSVTVRNKKLVHDPDESRILWRKPHRYRERWGATIFSEMLKSVVRDNSIVEGRTDLISSTKARARCFGCCFRLSLNSSTATGVMSRADECSSKSTGGSCQAVIYETGEKHSESKQPLNS